MTKTLVAHSENGCSVFVDTEQSHAATHLKAHPELLRQAKSIIPKMTLLKLEEAFDYDTGKILGDADIVETSDSDEIIYAKRLNREAYTRFAKDRQSEPTSFITIVLQRTERDEYDLRTIWIGPIVPPFPGDDRE